MVRVRYRVNFSVGIRNLVNVETLLRGNCCLNICRTAIALWQLASTLPLLLLLLKSCGEFNVLLARSMRGAIVHPKGGRPSPS